MLATTMPCLSLASGCLFGLCVLSAAKAMASEAEKPSARRSYDELLADGKVAYSDENWQKVVDTLEEAIDDYHAEKRVSAKCRHECAHLEEQEDHSGKKDDKQSSQSTLGDEEHAFVRRIILRAACEKQCGKRALGLRGPVMKTVRTFFDEAGPYEYLHFAYYKLGDFRKAAAAASTYLYFHQDNKDALSNVKFYSEQEGVTDDDLRSREPLPFSILYKGGANAHAEQKWNNVVTFMEDAAHRMYGDFNECRSNCETSSSSNIADRPETASFIETTVSLHRQLLECRVWCWLEIGWSVSEETPLEVVPSLYHYLQYAYYNGGNLSAAARAASTYMLFMPGDKTMSNNLNYYREMPNMKGEDFLPREDAVAAWDKLQRDRQLLLVAKQAHLKTEEEAFRDEVKLTSGVIVEPEDYFTAFQLAQEERAAEAEEEGEEVDASSRIKPQRGEKATPKREQRGAVVQAKKSDAGKISPVVDPDDEEIPKKSTEDYMILETSADHNGLPRVLADGFANKEQCKALMDLAAAGATAGSGYAGKRSPHTKNELFEGLTVAEAAEGAAQGKLSISSSILYLKLSEVSRQFLEEHFQMKQHLYFSYSHLVCRTSFLGGSKKGKGLPLSHPVHADNCILKEDGQCIKESPAYTWRDYSAILYLNDDFEGGNFFFAHKNMSVQHEVRPVCGRLVGFSAGRENLHGVLPVLRGRRCVIALWMTFSKDKDESNHDKAMETLRQLEQKHTVKANADRVTDEL